MLFYADGFIKLLKITETETPTGTYWDNGKMIYARTVTAVRGGSYGTWSTPSDELFEYIDELLYARMEKSHEADGSYTSDAKAQRYSNNKIRVYMTSTGYLSGDKLVILYTKK